MKPIDSKKQQLSLPEIIGQFVVGVGYEKTDAAKQMLVIMHEMQMPDAEGLNIGNTVFVSHYTKDKKKLMGWVANLDTKENFINNVEQYIRYIIENGVEAAIVGYLNNDGSDVANRVTKHKLAKVTTKRGENGIYVSEFLIANPVEEQKEQEQTEEM